MTDTRARTESARSPLTERPRRIDPWILALVAIVMAVAVEGYRSVGQAPIPAPHAAIEATRSAPLVLREIVSERLPMPADTPSAHASTLVSVKGELLAFWFAGTREGAPDVRIVGSRRERATGRWSAAFVAVDRHRLARALGYAVRRLGNPVAWVDAAQRVHLFVVATGPGGWAASRVVQLVSPDGREFTPQRVLPLSPLFNISTLVRTSPLALADGGALLPLYFELGIKYPLALRLDSGGTPLQLIRISSRRTDLQPTLLPLDASHLLALMRDQSGARRIQAAESGDGGLTWADRPPLDLPNPNASIAAARLPDGSFALALNPDEASRHELALARSRNGRDWAIELAVETGEPEQEYSYPALLVVGDELHLTYTWKRSAIAHRAYRMQVKP